MEMSCTEWISLENDNFVWYLKLVPFDDRMEKERQVNSNDEKLNIRIICWLDGVEKTVLSIWSEVQESDVLFGVERKEMMKEGKIVMKVKYNNGRIKRLLKENA